MLIREATVNDAEKLQEYIVRFFNERLTTVYQHDWRPTIEDERRFIENLNTTSNSVLLVAENQGKVVGMLDFHGEVHRQSFHVGQFGMSVDNDFRSMGIGTKLVEYLLEWASKNKISRIELQVFENNFGAIRLYEKIGFHKYGCRNNAVIIDGEAVDVILMAYDL